MRLARAGHLGYRMVHPCSRPRCSRKEASGLPSISNGGDSDSVHDQSEPLAGITLVALPWSLTVSCVPGATETGSTDLR